MTVIMAAFHSAPQVNQVAPGATLQSSMYRMVTDRLEQLPAEVEALNSEEKIKDVIGPGGKVIRGIVEQTGVKIDVEDDGTIHVASSDPVAANKALQIIADLTATAEVGKTYLGKVVRIVDFGGQERLPAAFRRLLWRWLQIFHVAPRPDLESVLKVRAAAAGATMTFARPYRGYAQYAVVSR